MCGRLIHNVLYISDRLLSEENTNPRLTPPPDLRSLLKDVFSDFSWALIPASPPSTSAAPPPPSASSPLRAVLVAAIVVVLVRVRKHVDVVQRVAAKQCHVLDVLSIHFDFHYLRDGICST